MIEQRLLYYSLLILFTASACAKSTKRVEPEREDRDARISDTQRQSVSDAGDRDSAEEANRMNADADGGVGASGDGGRSETDGRDSRGSDSLITVCGNGRVEGDEACDDGNVDSRDGCTTLCEFSCEQDADCDDSNDCNGVERCNDRRACEDYGPDLPEGAPCDDDKSCWRGVCVPNACGDGKQDQGEQCDDGNLDPNDGCTPDCELTCEADRDCAHKDACQGANVCRDDGSHDGQKVCIGGPQLENETACEIIDTKIKSFCGDPDIDKDGWCMDGACTCKGCGDGKVNGVEACDDGLQNGTSDSPNNCSRDCQVVVCQNGTVEGDEECDDGNDRPMDGCDPECKYEFAHRFTSMRLLKGVDVPNWCRYRNNRFAEALAGDLAMSGLPMNAVETISQHFSNQFAESDSFLVLHIIDSDDTSMKTADDDITVGIYQGHLPRSTDKPLDAPASIQSVSLNEDTLLPAEYHEVAAMQAGGGKILSREPSVIEMIDITGQSYPIHGFMLQLVFDMNSLSRPNAERFVSRDTIEISELIRLPESSTSNPSGFLCGAIGPEFNDRPIVDTPTTDPWGSLDSGCCKNRGDQIGTSYRGCDEDDQTDQCESAADIIRYGCTVCLFDLTADSAFFDNGCEMMKSKPESCFTLIKGIDFDVDSDGDGTNDSWSALFGFETQRVRIYDVEVR